MTEGERYELYLLRKHFGISALEALNVLPAWEYELLLAGLRAESAPDVPIQPEPGPRADPMAAVPSELKDLLG